MKKNNKYTLLALLLMLVLCLSTVVVNADSGERVVLGNSFTLNSGEQLNGNLIICGGDVELQSNTIVTGDVTMYGGKLRVNGTINGDLSAFGGNLKLEHGAVLDGDLVTLGTKLERESGSVVNGNTMQEIDEIDNIDDIYDDLDDKLDDFEVNPTTITKHRGFLGSLVFFITQAFLLTIKILVLVVLAIFVMLILEKKVLSGAATLVRFPFQSLGMGFLTVILVICASVAMSVTVILIPIALLLLVAFAGLCVYAWVIMGYDLGKRLAEWLHLKWDTIWLTAFGTFVLSFVLLGFLKVVPCIGWIPASFALLFGIGAVIINMTHIFGEGKKQRDTVQLLQARNAAAKPVEPDINEVVKPIQAEPEVVENDIEEAPEAEPTNAAEMIEDTLGAVIAQEVDIIEPLEDASASKMTADEAPAQEVVDSEEEVVKKTAKATKKKGVSSSLLDQLHDDIEDDK